MRPVWEGSCSLFHVDVITVLFLRRIPYGGSSACSTFHARGIDSPATADVAFPAMEQEIYTVVSDGHIELPS